MKKKIRKNYLEWVVFGVSTFLITLLLVYLTYQAFNIHEEAPPVVIVEPGSPQEQHGKYLIPVTIRNDGEQTAEDVNIVITLEKDGQPVEESNFVVPFLPRNSQKESWAVFLNNPAQHKITAKATGFNIP